MILAASLKMQPKVLVDNTDATQMFTGKRWGRAEQRGTKYSNGGHDLSFFGVDFRLESHRAPVCNFTADNPHVLPFPLDLGSVELRVAKTLDQMIVYFRGIIVHLLVVGGVAAAVETGI